MQKEEKNATAFSALSFKEQQEKWLSWRSQHLTYEPVQQNDQEKAQPAAQSTQNAPRQVQAPVAPVPSFMPQPPAFRPPRHNELDKVYQKHKAAMKKTTSFTLTSTT